MAAGVTEFIAPRAAVPMAVVTLVLTLTTLSVGAYIAYPGGRVRHREFRFEPPPEKAVKEGNSEADRNSAVVTHPFTACAQERPGLPVWRSLASSKVILVVAQVSQPAVSPTCLWAACMIKD